jgi:hypothetical protein
MPSAILGACVACVGSTVIMHFQGSRIGKAFD